MLVEGTGVGSMRRGVQFAMGAGGHDPGNALEAALPLRLLCPHGQLCCEPHALLASFWDGS